MQNAQVAGRGAPRLEMRWVPVVDDRGRTHMEAQWIAADQAAVADHAA